MKIYVCPERPNFHSIVFVHNGYCYFFNLRNSSYNEVEEKFFYKEYPDRTVEVRDDYIKHIHTDFGRKTENIFRKIYDGKAPKNLILNDEFSIDIAKKFLNKNFPELFL